MRWRVLVLLATLSATPCAAQDLMLKGSDGQSRTLSAQAFAALPHVTIHVQERSGPAEFAGVPVSALTALVGAPQGEALRGPAAAMVVVVTAADGYRSALALAETDASVRDQQVILADRRDGKPLDAKEGPLRLVVEADKRPLRSARQVTGLEVRMLP